MPDTIIRNEYGEVAALLRPAEAQGESARLSASPLRTVQQAANDFLRDSLSELNVGELHPAAPDSTDELTTDRPSALLTFVGEKDLAGAKVAIYKQTVLGLDVFEAQVGLQIDGRIMNVRSLQSSAHADISVENPQALQPARGERVSRKAIERHLGFALPGLSAGMRPRQVVYRYEPNRREDGHVHENAGCMHPGGAAVPHLQPLTIAGLTKGQHFICDEILFRAVHAAGETPVNWRMLVEPESGDVLNLRALVACVTGLVFDRDPQTQGGADVTGASGNAELNPFRSSVTLPGLVPSTPQRLKGEFVEIVDISAPAIAPPTVPGPSNAFNYDVRTDHFSAVNAYYNCDRLFRTMQSYGFDVASYFDGTIFPVMIDHRGKGGQLNADAPGTPAGTGLGMMRFGLILPPNEVGIATSNRVVWHEFGHALLWDHVSSPNFGFAHSAGDALAAILNDPGSQEADRFDTFPWVQQGASLGRRHDRAVEEGWAWFGPNYDEQYNGEQILSTTLFRFYRAIGGDAQELPTQIRASDASAFLIFKATGLLTSTTPYPEIFVQALQNADLTTPDFKGVPGGALHKVMRWAFEQQGFFQEEAAPGRGNAVSSRGDPPEVDVFIDDGRAGEYHYQANHWSCRDMWIRRMADGGTTHQHPLAGQTSYLYVRVQNRGIRAAENVTVSAYQSASGTGLSFPDDCVPVEMEASTIPNPVTIAPGESAIVGPFAFTASCPGADCLLAIASTADGPANSGAIAGTIAEHRFVPFDNNVGQRDVHPVLPEREWLVRWFRRRELLIRNPFREAKRAEISIKLPAILQERGWQVLVKSAGGKRFEMAAYERRPIVLGIREGSDLEPEAVQQAIDEGDGEIALTTTLDGELSGGVSYPLSFEVEREIGQEAPDDGDQDGAAENWLNLQQPTSEQVLQAIAGRELKRVVIVFGGDVEGDS